MLSSTEKSMKMLRLAERVLIILLMVVSSGAIWIYSSHELKWQEVYSGVGVAVLVVVMFVFVQRKIDKSIEVAIGQSGYVQDEVFASLYEKSPVAYLTIDSTGKITEANGAAVKLMEAEVGSLLNINFFSFIQTDDKVDPSVLMSKINAGLTVNEVEVSVKTQQNNLIWVTMSVSTLRDDGKRLVSLIDVTEQKNIDVAKSEFVALATHQLRTPISAIRWNVELLNKKLGDTKTENQERYLTKIERNVHRMIHLINDFLSVSKLEMGTYASNIIDIEMASFFELIVEESAEKITSKQLQLEKKFEPQDLVVKTDERLFHIIVSNLMTNAVKYAHPNGKLLISYELKGSMVEVILSDEGIGVPEAEIPKLFTKFYRATNAQTHQTEGTGLGLYVVKQSVEKLGGVISVNSIEGKSTVFTVNIPMSIVSEKKVVK